MSMETLEQIKAIAQAVLSWPVVALLGAVIFRRQIVQAAKLLVSPETTKAKFGPIEIERKIDQLSEQQQRVIAFLGRSNEVMLQSRLLELEVTQHHFGGLIGREYTETMSEHIAKLSELISEARGAAEAAAK